MSGERSPLSSPQSPSNKISRRQNCQSLTASWIAAQEDQQSSSSDAAAVQSEFMTPTITLTQPRESEEEKSRVLVPGLSQQSEGGMRRAQPPTSPPLDPAHSLIQQPKKHSSQLSTTMIVDKPILEEEEEKEEVEEEEEEEEEVKDEPLLPLHSISSQSLRSGWNRIRAQSFPSTSRGSSEHVMLQLPRPVAGGKCTSEGSEVDEHEVAGEGAKDGSVDGEQLTSVSKLVQMAVMAKKWKNRSKQEESSHVRNSREMLSTRQKRRPMVEMPRVLKLEVLEEAHHIVHKTLQMYRSELGLRHKLTLQAEQHCETLAQQLHPSHPVN